ncbi:MAG: metalloregulator ArsR/SmtB family transcription factor [Gammaproteobacteria bacterium]|nr:metalloregulator ArsR/SmtB family transcription factor [Gammaproteobacteria bacterium]
MARLENLATIFKALSDPNRLAILALIRKRCGPECRVSAEHAGNTVSELASQFELSLSTVSHHVKELKNAGLIRCEKRGQWVYCAINQSVLDKASQFLAS